MSKIEVGIVGCGRVAEHYRIMLIERDPVPDFSIRACCDVDRSKAESLSEAFDCAYFTELKTMVDEVKLDLLLILTPSGAHFENAKLALNSGVNVLIEKPITLLPEQARELESIATEKGLSCSSIFQNRYNPAVLAVKNAMEKGRFKEIVTATIRLRWCREQSYYEDGWHGTWEMDGGVINQQAIHHVDALRWICGPIVEVVAIMENRANNLEAEDTLVGVLKFENGALGTIEATTAARPRDFEASLSIVGKGGSVQVGGIALNKIVDWEFVEVEPEDANVIQVCSEEVPTGYGLSHTRLIREYLQAFDSSEKQEVPISVEESLPALELVHALYASVESGGWVKMKDQPRSRRLGLKNKA